MRLRDLRGRGDRENSGGRARERRDHVRERPRAAMNHQSRMGGEPKREREAEWR